MNQDVRVGAAHQSAAGPATSHVHILELNGESYRLKDRAIAENLTLTDCLPARD